MKVKYIGSKSSPLSLINGRVYECLGIEQEWLRIIDETGEDYLYPPEIFQVLDDDEV